MRAANEPGKKTVAVYAEKDKLRLHRFKTEQPDRIREGRGPVAAYLNIEEIIRVAPLASADARTKVAIKNEMLNRALPTWAQPGRCRRSQRQVSDRLTH